MANFLKNLAKKEILVPHLERWFDQDFSGHPEIPLSVRPDKVPDDAFHPSSDAVGCARLIYANHFAGHEKRKFNARNGFNGNMWHSLLQWVMVEGLQFATWEDIEARRGVYAHGDEVMHTVTRWPKDERPVDATWWATGSIDINNVMVPGRDERYLVDIKTMNRDSFARPTPPEFLWTKYVAQCQLYLEWAQLETAIVLGVEAAYPFSMKEILIHRDPDYPRYIYQKWDDVASAHARNEIPAHSCAEPDQCSTNAFYADISARSGSTEAGVGSSGDTS